MKGIMSLISSFMDGLHHDKKKKNNKGFTLIEIALVILILAILMYLIVPTGGLRDTARVQAVAKKIETIYISAQDCMIKHGGFGFSECGNNNALLAYLPSSARDDRDNTFWSTPWSNGSQAITISTEDGGGTLVISVDLSNAPQAVGDEPPISEQVAKYLQAKAKEVTYSDANVTVKY